VASEERRRAEFQFQPVFYRRDLDGHGRAEAARGIPCDTTECSGPYLNYRKLFLLVDRLRGSVSGAKKKKHHQDEFGAAEHGRSLYEVIIFRDLPAHAIYDNPISASFTTTGTTG
jgi:hypothetical protein